MLTAQDVKDAVDHCYTRLDVYDKAHDTVRVRRKFLERVVQYIQFEHKQPLTSSEQLRKENATLINELYKTKNLLRDADAQYRKVSAENETLRTQMGIDWRKIAAEREAQCDKVEAELCKERLRRRIVDTRRDYWRKRGHELMTLVEQIYTAHGYGGSTTRRSAGHYVLRTEEWKTRARALIAQCGGFGAGSKNAVESSLQNARDIRAAAADARDIRAAAAEKICSDPAPNFENLIKNIDARLRAWSDTPMDSRDELCAMASLTNAIKSAARAVAKYEASKC